jgi:hypothetical protein
MTGQIGSRNTVPRAKPDPRHNMSPASSFRRDVTRRLGMYFWGLRGLETPAHAVQLRGACDRFRSELSYKPRPKRSAVTSVTAQGKQAVNFMFEAELHRGGIAGPSSEWMPSLPEYREAADRIPQRTAHGDIRQEMNIECQP